MTKTRHIVKSFKHQQGGHCESTTMRDLIAHLGLPITEELIFGLDSTFGFVFLDNSGSGNPDTDFDFGIPLFIGGKQGTINENSLACRILGLNIKMETFSSSDLAWESSKALLDQDIPLGLQVDLGYLPYFEWDEDMHFGGHYITLVGYDEEKEVALVCDTEYDEIKEINFDQLKKARSSKFGGRFMQPHNKQVVISSRPDGKKPPFSRAVKLALQQVSRQFLAPSMNYHGIPAMVLFAESIPKWKDTLSGKIKAPYTDKIVPAATTTLEMMHGLIEEWGTGGSIFRNLYTGFLQELCNHPEINEGTQAWNEEELFYLQDAQESIFESSKLWGKFAALIKSGLDKDGKNCLETIDFKELERIIRQIIPLEESCFQGLSKIRL